MLVFRTNVHSGNFPFNISKIINNLNRKQKSIIPLTSIRYMLRCYSHELLGHTVFSVLQRKSKLHKTVANCPLDFTGSLSKTVCLFVCLVIGNSFCLIFVFNTVMSAFPCFFFFFFFL